MIRMPGRPLDAIAALALVIAACGLALTVGFSVPTNHDEFQYIAAAHLVGSERLYAEFFYSQTPYFPVFLKLWLDGLIHIVDSPYVLARAFNVLWSLVFIVTTGATLVSLSPVRSLAAAVLFGLAASSALDLPMRVVRNDMLPLALSSAVIGLYVCANRFSRHSPHLAAAADVLIGLLVAIAVGVKHSYAFVAVAVVLAPLMVRRDWRARAKARLVPIAAGAIVGSLPMLALASQSWENFVFAVFEFHQWAHLRWYELLGIDVEQEYSLWRRAQLLAAELADGPIVALALTGAGFLGLFGRRGARVLDDPRTTQLLGLCGIGVVLGIGVCLLAKPLHPQYVAPLLPFLATGVVLAARLADGAARAAGRPIPQRVFVGAGALIIGVSLVSGLVAENGGPLTHVKSIAVIEETPVELAHTHRVIGDITWVRTHLDRVTEKIEQVLGPPSEHLRIATLMPIYPIEAGFGIHPELASVPFFFRTNDDILDDDLERLIGLGPSTVEDWLHENGVRAVLTGYDPWLEEGFRSYAATRKMACFRLDLRGAYRTNRGYLYVDPALARQPDEC